MLIGTKTLITTAFLCLLLGCIQEIELSLGQQPTLVIDGGITTLEGSHRVTLSYSTGFNENSIFVPIRKEVLNANVQIVDDLGNIETLTAEKNGKYVTSSFFKGEVGRTYRLKVTLVTGAEYESLPETIQPVPVIDEIGFSIEEKAVATQFGVSNETYVVMNVGFSDEVEIDNYYRWKYRETYEVVAPLVPEDCVAGIVDEVFTPCPPNIRNCWATDGDNQFLRISDDVLFNGREVTDFEIYSAISSRKFSLGYSILIQQLSLTENAYRYLKSVKDQIGNTGSIFETGNYQLTGNIKATADENEVVLGFFTASSVAEKRLYISPSDYSPGLEQIDCTPGPSGNVPPTCEDCRAWPATNIKPDFWP